MSSHPYVKTSVCLVALFITLNGVGLAHAQIFGITLDKTCLTFIKNNLTSDCPTFELIDTLYPSSECPYLEGKCIDYFRQIGGHHYIVDPSALEMERIKMIEIRYEFSEFHLPGDSGYNNTAHTINYGLGRYLDGCKNAYIDSASWIAYTGDTINLFNHDCDPAYTYLKGERTEYINQTQHNIADSYKYQLEQWIKESKEKCLTKCFEY